MQSSQVDLQGPQSKDGFVTLLISCEMEQPNLQKLLYDLEAGMPFLFIDQLVVQGPRNVRRRGRRAHADLDRGVGSMEGHQMMVRHVLLAHVCGLCVIGATELSALAATSTDNSTQLTSIAGPSIWTRRRRKTRRSARRSGNPLWAIPLGSLSITRDRPIFTPSRRPPAAAVVAVPRVVQPTAVARPAEPERLNLTLIGTVVGKTEGIGVFLDQTTHDFVRLKTGEGHAGWILRSVKAREATLEKAQRTETLSLPAPQDAKSPAPVPARPE